MAEITLTTSARVRPALSRAALAPLLLVFLAGINLILIQWALVRELTTLLLGTELVVLLVSVSYFTGLSVGYLITNRIKQSWLIPLAVLTLILHLTLPIWFRLLVSGLTVQGAYGLAFVLLPLLTPFVVSAFYSVFLPLFVDTGKHSLPRLYATEIMGSAVGILILVQLGSLGLQVIDLIYTIMLLLIVWILGMRPARLLLLGIAAAFWLGMLPAANYWSNSLWYESIHGLPGGTKTLYSGYSPYQKVDVLETPDGDKSLFLDGLSHFNAEEGIRLNIVVGQIPTQLLHPQNALVIGAGVMQTEQMIAQSGHVTTVELDPVVVEVGLRYFQEFNQMDKLTNRTVIVDDAKHFISNTDTQFDLIVTDTPAALTLQTATLYSLPFYQQIADHLTPQGVLVANMTSAFTPNDIVSRRVAASLLANFRDVIVISPLSVGWSFAYASNDLPFDRQAVEAALRASGETQFTIFDTPAVRAIVGDAAPITLDSMDFVLQTSMDWIGERLSW